MRIDHENWIETSMNSKYSGCIEAPFLVTGGFRWVSCCTLGGMSVVPFWPPRRTWEDTAAWFARKKLGWSCGGFPPARSSKERHLVWSWPVGKDQVDPWTNTSQISSFWTGKRSNEGSASTCWASRASGAWRPHAWWVGLERPAKKLRCFHLKGGAFSKSFWNVLEWGFLMGSVSFQKLSSTSWMVLRCFKRFLRKLWGASKAEQRFVSCLGFIITTEAVGLFGLTTCFHQKQFYGLETTGLGLSNGSKLHAYRLFEFG